MLTWQNTGDPCTPDTVTSVNHLMPTRIGFTTALGPYEISTDNPAVNISGAADFFRCSAFSYFDSSQEQKMLFTAGKKIYRHPTNTNVSRGAAYTGDYFSFAQWRDKIYAANGADDLQVATTGSFADATGTTPVFTRIAVAGEFLAGIGLVSDFVGTVRTVTASPYMLMISGVGNPEQFDVDVDTSAYFQDIFDSGGPLTAIARLRNFFVVFQKSGVYVVENVGGTEKWSIRCVTDYYGCVYPDSVIEVNNVLYWLSPTRSGEVCMFDGAQVSGISDAIDATIVDLYGRDPYFGFPPPGGVTLYTPSVTSATDGETIVWNTSYCLDNLFSSTGYSQQLYLNVATRRFGRSSALQTDTSIIPWCVASNASQNVILCVKTNAYTAFPFNANFYAGYMAQMQDSRDLNAIEFFRGSDQVMVITNVTPRFSEYKNIDEVATAMEYMGGGTPYPRPPCLVNPTLNWVSTQHTGDSTTHASGVATPPLATWNTTTNAFDVTSSTKRSKSAKTFAFKMKIQPVNSLTGFQINYVPSGTGQTGGKAGAWQ